MLKALYLTIFEVTKKRSLPLSNWGKVYAELSIMYEVRYNKDINIQKNTFS